MPQTNKGFGTVNKTDSTQVLEEDQSTKATPDLSLINEDMKEEIDLPKVNEEKDSKTSDQTYPPQTTDEYDDGENETNPIEDNIVVNHGKNETGLVRTNERDISINLIWIVIPSVTTGLILLGVLICLLIIKKHER